MSVSQFLNPTFAENFAIYPVRRPLGNTLVQSRWTDLNVVNMPVQDIANGGNVVWINAISASGSDPRNSRPPAVGTPIPVPVPIQPNRVRLRGEFSVSGPIVDRPDYVRALLMWEVGQDSTSFHIPAIISDLLGSFANGGAALPLTRFSFENETARVGDDLVPVTLLLADETRLFPATPLAPGTGSTDPVISTSYGGPLPVPVLTSTPGTGLEGGFIRQASQTDVQHYALDWDVTFPLDAVSIYEDDTNNPAVIDTGRLSFWLFCGRYTNDTTPIHFDGCIRFHFSPAP